MGKSEMGTVVSTEPFDERVERRMAKPPTEYDPSFDVHSTDPMRLEIKKDLGLEHKEELKIPYKGFTITAFTKGAGNWVAIVGAGLQDFTGTKAEVITKAKAWIDANGRKIK